jgi:hypothetical protein
MWGRLGPRFALEAAFLILLAVGLGLADQDWVVIVAVMAGGWALVSLIELIASRPPPWTVSQRPVPEAPAEPVGAEPPAPPEPASEPAPAAVEPGPAEPGPPEDTQEVPPGEAPAEEAPVPPRRRWWRLGRRRNEPAGEDNGAPEPPKHVRKLEPPEAADAPAPAESAEERS